jgi:putative ABC transport system permease protein
MASKTFKLSLRAAWYSKRTFVYQTLIILLLSAVITGSLLTGYSVKESLKRSAVVKLGNTGILISSGERYLRQSLPNRFTKASGIQCTGFLELKGYSQNLLSQKKALNTNIFAVDSDFFSFHGVDSISVNQGEVIINRKLADYLGASAGDELIIHYRELSDVPAGAPFAPSEETDRMTVKKISRILEATESGNYSLSISQVEPMNIFIGSGDIYKSGKVKKINRLVTPNNSSLKVDNVYSALQNILEPEDIGLNLRVVSLTGETEIVSDRIFIDKKSIEVVQNTVPSPAPLLTYLANRIKKGDKSAPYSFISALPPSLYSEVTEGNDVIINEWLAEDLSAAAGDKIEISWYSPDSLNNLVEKSEQFLVSRVVKMEKIWSDSLLMPAFPGIVERKSCSDWDAGVIIKLDEIRQKDEDYWKKYAGTPKAFISYNKGKEIWGNNFGPATALRFPSGESTGEIREHMKGKLVPSECGLTVTNLYDESIKAANESVDFGSLFLSLGFFLILASLILLSFTISSYLDSKAGEFRTLFALGFKNGFISRLFFTEIAIMALPGALAGAFGGFLINILITLALNSVWQGAVQTDTLNSFFSLGTVISGFLVSVIPVALMAVFKIRRFLRIMNNKDGKAIIHIKRKRGGLILIIAAVLTAGLFLFSLVIPSQKVMLSFISGALMFISLLLCFRYLLLNSLKSEKKRTDGLKNPSLLYYSFYPSHALTPVLFIAAGLFAVFVTGANRATSGNSSRKASGGTGGYLLWCESSLPVMENLNTGAGRVAAGLDDERMDGITFIQAKRSQGNDASCLNLNHITMPPLLGIDPNLFIEKKAFSFAGSLKDPVVQNNWQFLNLPGRNNIVYGIADQTVLEWGMKIGIGDTVILRAETGEPLKIIIAGALKSSVFQGNILIGINNFTRYFPSVSGSSVILVDGKPELAEFYSSLIAERFENKGINIEFTDDRLSSFNEVTNTYLSVFMVLGGLGMITGIAGLGFILLRNYNLRRREFALMLATGFSLARIRKMIINEQLIILLVGLTTGFVSAVIATFPSVSGSGEIPWTLLLTMLFAIGLTGVATLYISARYITSLSLTTALRRE